MNTHTFRFQNQAMRLGLGGKLLLGTVAIAALVGGFFISLFMLAVGGTVAALALVKMWWSGKSRPVAPVQRRKPGPTVPAGQVIEGEYRVK